MTIQQLITNINRLGIRRTRLIQEALYSHTRNLEHRLLQALPHAYLKEKYASEKALRALIGNGSYTYCVAEWAHNETPPSLDEVKKEVRQVAGAWKKFGIELKEIAEVPDGSVVYATFKS